MTGDPDPEALAVVVNDPGLRRLRHGDYQMAPAYAWLWRSPLAQRLETFGVSNMTRERVVWGRLALAEWLETLGANAPATLCAFELAEQDSLDFEPAGWTVRFTRSEGTRFDALVATWTGGIGRIQTPIDRLAGGLAELPRGALRSVAIEGATKAMRDAEEYGRLRAELARLG